MLLEDVIAWEGDRNTNSVTVDRRFTTADARIKLKKLYPIIRLTGNVKESNYLTLFFQRGKDHHEFHEYSVRQAELPNDTNDASLPCGHIGQVFGFLPKNQPENIDASHQDKPFIIFYSENSSIRAIRDYLFPLFQNCQVVRLPIKP